MLKIKEIIMFRIKEIIMFNTQIEILILGIKILNKAASIVGGIWLAVSGELALIGIGIIFMFTSHWILFILMIPGLLLAGVTMKFYENNNVILGHLFGFISQLYTNILIFATCFFAFIVCSNFYKGDVGVGYIPYLLWSWSMALTPWQFFASKEPENEFSAITLFSISVFYTLFLISMFISPLITLIIIIIFGVVQLIVFPVSNLFLSKKW